MSSTSAIGSQIRITYQTNFPTFTPDQISKILKEKEYTIGQSRITDIQQPNVPSITVPMFSKDNISIFINQPVNQIGFIILNTINLDTVYKEITTILSSLNIISEVILNISFVFITRYKVKKKPQEQMTAMLKEKFVENLSSEFEEKFVVTSIRLSTSFPPHEGLQIIFEPLSTSPEDHYFINISYQTIDWDAFQSFMEKFGEEMIKEFINEVEKIA